jgi:hypothetical protein
MTDFSGLIGSGDCTECDRHDKISKNAIKHI